jgi:SDR family mycofactocin-dependent oxidoreductase
MLDGKVAFITGAARGQGRSHAITLAKEGADIIAVDIDYDIEGVPYPGATASDLEETVKQVEALDRRIIASKADIRDGAALKKAADEGVEALGRLDIVSANAGISTMVPVVDMTEEQWDVMIDVNLTGQFKTVKATLPHIIAGGRGGSIILTSSMVAMMGTPNIAHYSAAKAGLIGFMQSLAVELADQSIRVNTVHPTTVRTPMIINDPTFKQFRPDLESPTLEDFEVAARTMNRLPTALIEAIDVSNAVLYLASDMSRFVTGTQQRINAGAGF